MFLIEIDLRMDTSGAREFLSRAITQFYVPSVAATSEQIQLGGDNYRLKRLNPAGYRFRRPIIDLEGGPSLGQRRRKRVRAATSEKARSKKDGRRSGTRLCF